MVIANAQKPLAPPEAGDLAYLILRVIENILNEPCLLLLHLHDELDAAGVEDTLAVFAALQAKQVLHSLCGSHRNASQAAYGFHHLQHKPCCQRIGAGAHQGP